MTFKKHGPGKCGPNCCDVCGCGSAPREYVVQTHWAGPWVLPYLGVVGSSPAECTWELDLTGQTYKCDLGTYDLTRVTFTLSIQAGGYISARLVVYYDSGGSEQPLEVYGTYWATNDPPSPYKAPLDCTRSLILINARDLAGLAPTNCSLGYTATAVPRGSCCGCATAEASPYCDPPGSGCTLTHPCFTGSVWPSSFDVDTGAGSATWFNLSPNTGCTGCSSVFSGVYTIDVVCTDKITGICECSACLCIDNPCTVSPTPADTALQICVYVYKDTTLSGTQCRAVCSIELFYGTCAAGPTEGSDSGARSSTGAMYESAAFAAPIGATAITLSKTAEWYRDKGGTGPHVGPCGSTNSMPATITVTPAF